LLSRVEQKSAVTIDDVRALAERPELRHFLFGALRDLKRDDLIPHDFDDLTAQGASALAYWMMHPNELQDPPEKIELAAQIERTVNGVALKFFVYRFKMPDGHWAGQAWILGLAGPMHEISPAYSRMHSAFARCGDLDGKTDCSEIVDWWVNLNKGRPSA
jgi:hypothetical protein